MSHVIIAGSIKIAKWRTHIGLAQWEMPFHTIYLYLIHGNFIPTIHDYKVWHSISILVSQ